MRLDAPFEQVTRDVSEMVYADSMAEVLAKRKAFLAKWRLKCRAMADSLEERTTSKQIVVACRSRRTFTTVTSRTQQKDVLPKQILFRKTSQSA